MEYKVTRPFHQGLFWSRQYLILFLSIGCIFAKIHGNLQALSSNILYIRGKIWSDRLSPPRVGYRKRDRLLFKNMLKNSSRSKQSFDSSGGNLVQIGPIGKNNPCCKASTVSIRSGQSTLSVPLKLDYNIYWTRSLESVLSALFSQ